MQALVNMGAEALYGLRILWTVSTEVGYEGLELISDACLNAVCHRIGRREDGSRKRSNKVVQPHRRSSTPTRCPRRTEQYHRKSPCHIATSHYRDQARHDSLLEGRTQLLGELQTKYGTILDARQAAAEQAADVGGQSCRRVLDVAKEVRHCVVILGAILAQCMDLCATQNMLGASNHSVVPRLAASNLLLVNFERVAVLQVQLQLCQRMAQVWHLESGGEEAGSRRRRV
jgi:hypothetical protein